jgi:4-amino-4-deoxy-L-arabinose transferase-like glycosyltransferase
MDHPSSDFDSRPWISISILLGLCFILYFVNLGRWDLWTPDEPRYAEVSREMITGGDWVLMHRNGQIYADKPPLFFWAVALSSFLWQGFSSFSVRFPSALFGTLTVLLTFLAGKRLFSTRTGLLSGLVLATSTEFVQLSTRGNIDATLAFFTTAALFSFLHWYQQSREKESLGTMKGLSFYGYYGGMALATLTKGPVGFILPLFIPLVFLVIQRDWKRIRAMRLLPGLFLFAVITLSWYLPAVLKGGKSYLNETLMSQSLERFVKRAPHIKPIYYYLYQFPMDFLPWVFFLPAAIVSILSRKRMEQEKTSLFLLVWMIFIFIFFSLSKGKRALYLLPLFPAASLMIGKLWDDLSRDRIQQIRREWISFALYGMMSLSLIGGAVLPWIVSAKFPTYLLYSLPVALLWVGGGVGLFFLGRLRYYGAVFFLIVGMAAGGFFYTLRVIFPLMNPHKSARFICQEITSRIQPGERLAIYRVEAGPYNFYTGIVPILELVNAEDLIRFLKSPGRVFCLMRSRDFRQFQIVEGRPEVQVIARRGEEDSDFILISNQ